jgi:hypothetical protein
MIELVVIVGFVVPIVLWQFYDLDKAKKETSRKHLEAAAKELNPLEVVTTAAPERE